MPDSTSRSAWERPWRERPGEQAALLNPAFVGEIVARVVTRYRRSGERPLPLPLAFLVPPLYFPRHCGRCCRSGRTRLSGLGPR